MYSTHPSEFPDEPLPVMIDPTLLIIALLLLLIVGLGMFAWGRHAARTAAADEVEARKRILAHIRKAADKAVAAGPDEAHAKAAALRTAIREALGPVIAAGYPLGERYHRLDDILNRRRPREPDRREPEDAGEADTGPATHLNITHSTVIVAPGEGGDRDRGATGLAELRAAVQAIADHWREGGREAELADAQAALLRPKLPKAAPAH